MARRAKNKGKSPVIPSTFLCALPVPSSDSTLSERSSTSSTWPPPSLPPSFTPELLALSYKNIEDLSEDETEERNHIFAQHDRLWKAYIDKLLDHIWPDMASVSEDESTRWTLEILEERERVCAKEGVAFRNWQENLSLREKILFHLGPEIDDEGYH